LDKDEPLTAKCFYKWKNLLEGMSEAKPNRRLIQKDGAHITEEKWFYETVTTAPISEPSPDVPQPSKKIKS
jgi:hypothetical protein